MGEKEKIDLAMRCHAAGRCYETEVWAYCMSTLGKKSDLAICYRILNGLLLIVTLFLLVNS